MAVINLIERFPDYRISFDEGYSPAHVPRDKLDPWYMQISCTKAKATIYARSGSLLALEIIRGPIANLIFKTVPGIRILQDGEKELTLIFHEAQFDEIAKIVKPRKRRKLSPDHKAKLLAAGHRFQARDGTQSGSSTRQGSGATTPDPSVGLAGAFV